MLGYLVIICVTLSSYARAQDFNTLPALSGMRSMNGIDPAVADRFWEKWRLVGVRFRKDNSEQRFTYANDIAYKAIQNGAKAFPNGSMFGKIAFLAGEDPAFPNSLEPSNWTRVQLMLKDSERFKQHDGWNYWITYATAEEDPKKDAETAIACHACHTIVRNKDYIFSRAIFLDAKSSAVPAHFVDLFKESTAQTELEKAILSRLPAQPAKIWRHEMPLFQGSIAESIGPLSSYALRDQRTYILIDSSKKRFIAAQPVAPTAECKSLVTIVARRDEMGAKGAAAGNGNQIARGEVCDGTNRWVESQPLTPDFQ